MYEIFVFTNYIEGWEYFKRCSNIDRANKAKAKLMDKGYKSNQIDIRRVW